MDTMNSEPTQEKAEVVRLLLLNEGRVMLCLDATREGVEVPRRFSTDPGLMLVINADMPQAIEIGPEAIESELRFGGVPHYCIIPFNALWSAFNPDSGHGVLWRKSLPESIWLQHGTFPTGPLKPLPTDGSWATTPQSEAPMNAAANVHGGIPVFKVIEGAKVPPLGKQRTRPNLRLVK